MMAGERLKTEDRRLKTARELTAKNAKNTKRSTGSGGHRDLSVRIGDIAEVFDGPHATPTKTEAGPYFLSISSLNKGRLDLSKSAHLNEKDFIKWTKRVTPETGDLLFSYETRLGEAALMPEGIKACLGRRMGLLRPREDKVIPKYLLYAYLSPHFQQTIISNTITGATVDRLAISEFPNFQIRLPPLDEQQKIASLLSALDAKIELNNRINAELEAMAKTLYDYWFVQFDFPFDFTKGKPAPNGRPYKTSGGKMVYNPTLKRKIPAGWKVTTVGETFRTTLGGTPSRNKPSYWEPPQICWLNSEDKGTLFVVNADEYISKEGLKNSAAKLLPAGTVILSIVRHLRGSILGIEATTNQSVVGIEEKENISSSFIYPLILREIPRYMTQRTGAQQPHINKEAVDETIIVLPDDTALQLYQTLAAPLFNTIKTISLQTQQLTELRDWLLPMLMNGQVQVA